MEAHIQQEVPDAYPSTLSRPLPFVPHPRPEGSEARASRTRPRGPRQVLAARDRHSDARHPRRRPESWRDRAEEGVSLSCRASRVFEVRCCLQTAGLEDSTRPTCASLQYSVDERTGIIRGRGTFTPTIAPCLRFNWAKFRRMNPCNSGSAPLER